MKTIHKKNICAKLETSIQEQKEFSKEEKEKR